MSLETTRDIQTDEDLEEQPPSRKSIFLFHTPDPHNRKERAISISDSAYDSMVCSPFTPLVFSKTLQNESPINQECYPTTQNSISPLVGSLENDEVFQLSMEQIYSDRSHHEFKIPTSSGYTTFRPIPDRFSSSMQIRQCHLTSQRSTSTQTKYSTGSTTMYRPNSAPLQEGVEEELEEIDMDQMVHTRERIHRNSTSYCMHSPMPDLIQPTFHNQSQLLGSRLSLIADQIDEGIYSQTAANRSRGRTRRLSTPTLADLTPGGSLGDLIVSICSAFGNSQSRSGGRRHTTTSQREDH